MRWPLPPKYLTWLRLFLISLSTYASTLDGCATGGYVEDALQAIVAVGGVTQEKYFPYLPQKTTCKLPLPYTATLTVIYKLYGERAMINHVLTVGPIVAYVNTYRWDDYTSGIFDGCFTINQNRRTALKKTDHAIQIVGVNTKDGYWLIRNSWGTNWGLKGYMKLKLVCGLSLCLTRMMPWLNGLHYPCIRHFTTYVITNTTNSKHQHIECEHVRYLNGTRHLGLCR